MSNPETSTIIIEKVIEVPLEKIEEQGIVVVHCRFDGDGAVRIWRSTFLIDSSSNHRSRLLHAENISLYPNWTLVSGSGHTFTLFFEALPGSCKVFDLKEIIPQDGGFHVKRILRNETDIYRVMIE